MSAVSAPLASPTTPVPRADRSRPVRTGTGRRPAVGPMAPAGLAPVSAAQAARRRVAVSSCFAALVTAVALGLSGLGSPAATATASTPTTSPVATTVVVQPGQTVWQVAAEHAPVGVTTADYVARLVQHNGLDGGTVEAWQVLRLPAAG